MWRSALYLLLTLCGVMYSGAVVGGYLADIHDFPYMVSVYEVKAQKNKCGGSIISLRHVLSAAHCFRFLTETTMDPNMVKVIAGASYIGSPYADEWSWGHELQIRRVQRIHLHPDYDAFHSNIPYDIAILTVSREFQITNAVNIIPLPPFRDTIDAHFNVNVTLSGYGILAWNITKNKRLHAVDMEILRMEFCQRIGLTRRVQVLEDQNICARQFNRPRNKNVCDGDDGGPGVINGVQIAVVMWPTCARVGPAFLSRTDFYIDWIRNNINIPEPVVQ